MSIDNKKILLIITARGGSKRLPGKNTRLINGKPMIAYAIEAAKKSKYVDRVIVSTDDEKTAKISKKFGAEIPFMRPAELATDTASSLAVLQHAVNWMESKEGFKADIIALIQPTSPLVLAEDVDATIEKMIYTKSNSSFSVCEVHHRPEWMFFVDKNKTKPYIVDVPETARSQDFPALYTTNGAVYAMKRDLLMKRNMIRDRKNSCAYIMPVDRSIDIDTQIDFELTKILFKNINNKKSRKK